MINVEMLNKWDAPKLNAFTRALKKKCLNSDKNESVLAKMRDGRWIVVCWGKCFGDEDHESFFCKNENDSFYWEANGESITSSDFDLIEFKDS